MMMMVMVPVYIGQPTQMSQQGQLLCHAGLPVTAKKRISPDYCNRSIDVSIYLYYFWLFACTIVDAEPYQSNVLGSCYIPSCRSCPRQNQRSRHPWKTENYTLYPWHLSEMMMMIEMMTMMMMSNKTSSQSVCLAQMEDDRVRSWHTLIVTASPSWFYDSCCICLFIIYLFVCYLFVYLLVNIYLLVYWTVSQILTHSNRHCIPILVKTRTSWNAGLPVFFIAWALSAAFSCIETAQCSP